jgi:rubredoxin/uncharacterized membrane protein
MKRWKCTVCGYIHEGPEPPEECPMCGASRDKFEELVEDVKVKAGSGIYSRATGLMTKHRAHPISVHFPNGLLPVTVLFLLISFIFETMGFARASFYNLFVVALSMPAVLFSGYVDWQARYKGALTYVFRRKIAMGVIVTGLSWILVIWRLWQPEVAGTGGFGQYGFLGVHLEILGAAGYAGYLGGNLVFKD